MLNKDIMNEGKRDWLGVKMTLKKFEFEGKDKVLEKE